MTRTHRPGCSEVVLEPAQYALALGQAVRLPVEGTRPPRIIVLREAGTRRWACCRVLLRHKQLTPILKRPDPIRTGSFAVLASPPLWEES